LRVFAMSETHRITIDHFIPEADLPYVFDRFFRVEKHRGRSGGAGLGLAITKAIAEAHNGRLAIESLVDQGTTVRLAIRRDD